MPPTETDWHPYGPADPTDRSLDDEKGEEQEEGEHDEETEQDEEEGEEKEEQREEHISEGTQEKYHATK